MRLLIASTLPLPLILIVGCGAIVEAETKGASAGIASSSSTGGSNSDTDDPTTPTSETMTTSPTTATTATTTTTTATTDPTTDPTTTTTDPGTASDPTTSSTSTGPETTGPACIDSECELGVCINGACAPPPSCFALLDAHNELIDGDYMIDGDGPGGDDPVEITCDMTEGGWSCVYFNDFESDSEGWSKTDINECDGTQILGGHKTLGKGNPVERFFDLYNIPHAELRLSAVLYALDSWDDEELRIDLDGDEFWSKTCAIGTPELCDHSKHRCGNGLWWDGRHPFVVTTAHDAIDAVLLFSTNLSQGMDNESFGLDDVRVCIK